MKRIFTSLFIILFFLTACGNDELTNTEPEVIEEQLTINGGSVGGVWSIFTEGIAEAIRKEYPGTMISASPGTVAGNPILVHQEKVEFAIAESLTALFALTGRSPFENAYENIMGVAAVIPENVFQFVAPKSAPFNSVKDIADENIPIRYSPGEKDALGDIISETIFESFKLNYDYIEEINGEINYLSGTKSFELMRDGRLDGLGKMVPIPAGDIMEASATLDLKLIPIEERAIQYLTAKFPVTRYTIPAGSYDFQTEDYETINTPTILLTHKNMSEDVVYKVTKAIYHQLDYLSNVHSGFEKINNDTITKLGGIPLHPGAEKFYKELGLLKD